MDEQVRLYSDQGSEAYKAARKLSVNYPQGILYANLTCQKALTYFPAMLDVTTASIENAALFWYGSRECFNTATSSFIRGIQAEGRLYDQVKKYISELAGGLNPGDARYKLPKATLQTLMALADEQISKPSKALAAEVDR